MLSKISKCIQKVPATNSVSLTRFHNLTDLSYRLQLLPPPGASATSLVPPIILSKLNQTTARKLYYNVERHAFWRDPAFSVLTILWVFSIAETGGFMQFSKAPTSANFGDLPRGEIPEPLKVNRPFRKCLPLDTCFALLQRPLNRVL